MGAVWELARPRSEEVDFLLHSCMIDACAKCGCMEKALEVFARLKLVGAHRSASLYASLIRGHSGLGQLEFVLDLFVEAHVEERLAPSALTYAAAAKACLRCGETAAG